MPPMILFKCKLLCHSPAQSFPKIFLSCGEKSKCIIICKSSHDLPTTYPLDDISYLSYSRFLPSVTLTISVRTGTEVKTANLRALTQYKFISCSHLCLLGVRWGLCPHCFLPHSSILVDGAVILRRITNHHARERKKSCTQPCIHPVH